MELILCGNGLEVGLIRGAGAEREQAEQETLASGASLPVVQRALWAANAYRWEPWFLLIREAGGKVRGGVGMERIRSRALPGHVLLRVRHFGGNLAPEVCRAALEALTRLARKDGRVLRLHVDVFAREGKEAIEAVLSELGYRQVIPPGSYKHTVVIDLQPSEEEIFSTFRRTGRDKIRESTKKSLRTETITGLCFAGPINELQQQAVQRSGGQIAAVDWVGVIGMSARHPELSHVVGLFAGEESTPESLCAFGWACNNGEDGEFRAAGAARRPDIKAPLGYLPAWDEIRWAKSAGAKWFDMGGVTLTEGDEADLKGISDFKRHFSQNVVEVGAEWLLTPRPGRARLADWVSNSGRRLAKRRN